MVLSDSQSVPGRPDIIISKQASDFLEADLSVFFAATSPGHRWTLAMCLGPSMQDSALGKAGESSPENTVLLAICVLLEQDPVIMRRRRALNTESRDLGPWLVCGHVTFPFFICFLFCKMRVLGWIVYLILVTSMGSRVIQALPRS